MIFSDSKCFASSDRVERRLAAILVADVAGYSRLMHVSEEATHESDDDAAQEEVVA